MGVRALEQTRPGRPLRARHQGAVVCLPDPVGLDHDEIVWHIQQGGGSLLPEARMPLWKAALLLERWLAHHGLGTAQDVMRATFLVEKYEDHLAYDLQAFVGVNLRDLWQRREYRHLLQLIDRLPRHSYYTDAVSNDPEHSKMIADAQAKAKNASGGAEEEPRVPLVGWTPEVAVMTDVLDAVRRVQHTLVMVNSDPKKASPEPPKPAPRPSTLLQKESVRAESKRRQEKHEALAARLLGKHRKQGISPADTLAETRVANTRE